MPEFIAQHVSEHQSLHIDMNSSHKFELHLLTDLRHTDRATVSITQCKRFARHLTRSTTCLQPTVVFPALFDMERLVFLFRYKRVVKINDFIRRPIFQHTPCVKQDNAITERLDFRHTVRDEKDGRSLLTKSTNTVKALVLKV
ncbi:hypothetical protein ASF90_07225 [Xanthomonas sp. Leaf148]|nr:hypothetical protein ASF90_07225 [Xanthomonas sp. Leaf148]